MSKKRIRKAYRYRIYPGKTVASRIDETIETCRRVYNRCMAKHNDASEAGAMVKRNEYYAEIIREPRKADEFLQRVPAQVLNEVIDRLRRNWNNYFKSLKAWRAKGCVGPMPKPPRFKGRGFYNSFTYPQTGFRLLGNRLWMSFIGEARIKLHRSIEGEVKTLTIKQKNGKYYAIFSCDLEKPDPAPKTGKEVGIDLGIMCFYATSDGERVYSPRPYKEAQDNLARLQQELSRKKKGSIRERKARLKLAIAHERVANIRRDFFSSR